MKALVPLLTFGRTAARKRVFERPHNGAYLVGLRVAAGTYVEALEPIWSDGPRCAEFRNDAEATEAPPGAAVSALVIRAGSVLDSLNVQFAPVVDEPRGLLGPDVLFTSRRYGGDGGFTATRITSGRRVIAQLAFATEDMCGRAAISALTLWVPRAAADRVAHDCPRVFHGGTAYLASAEVGNVTTDARVESAPHGMFLAGLQFISFPKWSVCKPIWRSEVSADATPAFLRPFVHEGHAVSSLEVNFGHWLDGLRPAFARTVPGGASFERGDEVHGEHQGGAGGDFFTRTAPLPRPARGLITTHMGPRVSSVALLTEATSYQPGAYFF